MYGGKGRKGSSDSLEIEERADGGEAKDWSGRAAMRASGRRERESSESEGGGRGYRVLRSVNGGRSEGERGQGGSPTALLGVA